MNLAAPFIAQFFSETLLAALPYCDVVIGNEGEAAAFGAQLKLEDCSPEAVAKHIASMPKQNSHRSRIAIITQGASETIVVVDGAVCISLITVWPSREIHHYPLIRFPSMKSL